MTMVGSRPLIFRSAVEANQITEGTDSVTQEEKMACISARLAAILQIARENNLDLVRPLDFYLPRCDALYRFELPQGRLQFEMDEKNGYTILRYQDTVYYVTPLAYGQLRKALVGRKNGLSRWMEGDQLEKIKLLKARQLEMSAFDPGEWDTQKALYRESIYMDCLLVLNQMLPTNGTVLELCGGDGEFARIALKRCLIRRYILVDGNPKALQIARERLSNNPDVTIAEANVSTCDYGILLEGRRVDVVFGIGALAEQVMNRASVLNTLSKTVALLKEGGFMFFTGLTSSWVTREDLENAGLRVLNCTAPSRLLLNGTVEPEFYIAQKGEMAGERGICPYPLQERSPMVASGNPEREPYAGH